MASPCGTRRSGEPDFLQDVFPPARLARRVRPHESSMAGPAGTPARCFFFRWGSYSTRRNWATVRLTTCFKRHAGLAAPERRGGRRHHKPAGLAGVIKHCNRRSSAPPPFSPSCGHLFCRTYCLYLEQRCTRPATPPTARWIFTRDAPFFNVVLKASFAFPACRARI